MSYYAKVKHQVPLKLINNNENADKMSNNETLDDLMDTPSSPPSFSPISSPESSPPNLDQNLESEYESKPESEPESKPESEPEPEPEAVPETSPETPKEAISEITPEPEEEKVVETETETETVTETVTKAETETETETETDTDTETSKTNKRTSREFSKSRRSQRLEAETDDLSNQSSGTLTPRTGISDSVTKATTTSTPHMVSFVSTPSASEFKAISTLPTNSLFTNPPRIILPHPTAKPRGLSVAGILGLTKEEPETEKAPFPKAILTCKGKASFRDRNLNLSEPIKIGRAVGKCRPSSSNGIFDCKVLSRNHALLYYEKNKFFLQDSGSSNGTFVNSVRLSNSNDNSLPKEVFSGDHVQFGVDVTESTKYVTIPCIAASLKLYHPDGTEAKVIESSLNSNVKSFNMLELNGWLQEARQREEILRNKLVTLSAILHKAQASSEQSWKSMVEEDILLSRIESLQTRVKSLLESDHNRPDEVIVHLWKEVMHLQEDREKYEAKAKDAIQKVLQEKLMVISKNYELQVALSSAEEQRDHYKNACDSLLEEMKKLAEEHDKQFKDLQEMQEKYKVLAAAFENISNELKPPEKPPSDEEETESSKLFGENGFNVTKLKRSKTKGSRELDRSIVDEKYPSLRTDREGDFNHFKPEIYRPHRLPSKLEFNKLSRRTSKDLMKSDDEDTIQDLITSLGFKTRASSQSDSPTSDPEDKLDEFKEAIQKHIESKSATSLTSSFCESSNQPKRSPDEPNGTNEKCFEFDDTTGQLTDQLNETESQIDVDDETNSSIEKGDSSIESPFSSSQETIADANHSISESDGQSSINDSEGLDETLIINETILEAPIMMMTMSTTMVIPVINEINVCTIDETDAVTSKPYEVKPEEEKKNKATTNFETDTKRLSLSSANTNIVPNESVEMKYPPIDSIGNNFNSVQNEPQSLSGDHITTKNNESSLLIDKDHPKNKWETNMGFNISLFFFSLSFFLSFFFPFSFFFFFSSFFFFSLFLSRFFHSLVFCIYQLILFSLLFFLTFFSSLSSFFFPLFSLLFIVIYLFLFLFFFLSIYF